MRIVGVIAGIVALLVGCTQPTPKPQSEGGQPIVITSEALVKGGSDTIRLGRMHEGEILAYALQLVNQSPNHTLLRDYERTCGCTTLEVDKVPIAPQESLPATLYFDSRGEWGWQLKLIRLDLEGSQAPFNVWIEAEIE